MDSPRESDADLADSAAASSACTVTARDYLSMRSVASEFAGLTRIIMGLDQTEHIDRLMMCLVPHDLLLPGESASDSPAEVKQVIFCRFSISIFLYDSVSDPWIAAREDAVG